MAYGNTMRNDTYGDLYGVGSMGRNQHTGSSIRTPGLFN